MYLTAYSQDRVGNNCGMTEWTSLYGRKDMPPAKPFDESYFNKRNYPWMTDAELARHREQSRIAYEKQNKGETFKEAILKHCREVKNPLLLSTHIGGEMYWDYVSDARKICDEEKIPYVVLPTGQNMQYEEGHNIGTIIIFPREYKLTDDNEVMPEGTPNGAYARHF